MPRCSLLLGPIDRLERELAADVAGAQAADPLRPVVILVGETLLKAYLRRRLAEINGPHLNVHILTPGELGLRVGELQRILAGERPLPLLADRILAQEAALSEQTYFDIVAATPGFGQALHRTLMELRRAGLTAADLAEGADDALEPDKTRALATLAARHEELRRGHYDADSALAAPDPDRLGADELLVYGLWDPPSVVKRAVRELGRRHDLRVYLPSSEDGSEHAHERFRDWLAAELDAEQRTLDPDEPKTALAHVQRHLGRPAAASTDSDGTVRIASAPDPNREVRDALRTCLGWAREHGIGFHEMAIAYREPDPYRPLLDGALREAGLPAYIDEGTPLAELPVGRRALALLDLLEGDLDRPSVIAFAADARFPQATRERYPGSAAAWDGYSRRAGVVRGHDQWRTRLATHREAESHRTDQDGNRPDWLDRRLEEIDGLVAFVDELADRIAACPTDGAWSKHLAYLNGLFKTYLDGHEPITGALEALARLDGLTATVTADRFARTVRAVIAGLTHDDASEGRAGAFRARGINVIDVNSLRHMRFRAVCVLGLAERHFPPAPREDPLLLDAEREHLNSQRGWDLPLRARRADPEPLQFALAVGAAEEFLQLSYPRTEHGSGRPLYASGFLRSAAEAMAGRRIAAEQLDDIEADWFIRLRGARVGAAALGRALDELDYDRTLAEVDRDVAIRVLGETRPSIKRGRTAWIARRFSPRLTEFDGGLTGTTRDALAVDPAVSGPMSPTALEQYAKCSLQFFLNRVLGLRALDEPEDVPRIHYFDRGDLVHTILERVLASLLPGDPPRRERTAGHLELIDRIAREEFACFETERNTGHPQMWLIEQSVILSELHLWYGHEVQDALQRPFDRAAFEVTYGMELTDESPPLSTVEPATIDLGGRQLEVRGKIDRLQWDESGSSFLVIDYKTGRQRDKKTATFEGGKALQLPLYLHGAGLLLDRPPQEGTAEYFYVSRQGKFARHVMRGETLAASAEEFEQILSAFVDGMRGGLFPARPEAWTCRFCDFKGICPEPAEHASRMAQKQDDPRLPDLLAALEIA